MGRGDEREQQSVSRYGEKSSVERLNFHKTTHIEVFFFLMCSTKVNGMLLSFYHINCQTEEKVDMLMLNV